MESKLTTHSIANTIRMSRSLHKGTFLIVEGWTDSITYGKFVNESLCKVIPANSKDNATGALKILDKGGVKGVIAVVDSDFSQLGKIKPSSVNLFLTDTHDIETMILKSDALDHVMVEYGSSSKVFKLGKPISEVLLNSALPIGFMRWVSSPAVDKMNLSFKGLSFNNFVSKSSLITDTDNLVNEVANNSKRKDIDKKILKKKLKILEGKGHDPWHVCCGHDMIEILNIGFKNIFGNKNSKALTSEIIASSLRLAYQYSHFRKTKLYGSLIKWTKNNEPFKIFI